MLVATKPVDFRRGADSLAALAREELQRDPFSGVIIVFRSKRADRLKILTWTDPGSCCFGNGSNKTRFAGRRSETADATVGSQLAALVDGLDWSRLHARDVARPEAAS